MAVRVNLPPRSANMAQGMMRVHKRPNMCTSDIIDWSFSAVMGVILADETTSDGGT